MGQISRYAFLVKHKSYSSRHQHAFMGTNEFSTNIVGVSHVEEAVAVSRELIQKGIQLVELCGGFTEEEKDYIKQKTGNNIPMGVVHLSSEDEALLTN